MDFDYTLQCHLDFDYTLHHSTAKHGDNAPELADLYFAYGKALLENAIAQSSVLGKDGAEEAVVGATGASFLLSLPTSLLLSLSSYLPPHPLPPL